MANRWETVETVTGFIFLGSKITAYGDCSHEIKRHLLLRRKAMTKKHIKKQRHYFANKGPSSQSYGFSRSHVWMWELNHKEIWMPKNWFIRKDPDAGKDWRQEEKGMTEDEMVGEHHWLNELEFEQALGVGDGQGSLACCSPWGCKESDMTEWLNWTELK